MNLADEYRRQQALRSWPTVLDALPPVAGKTLLDLGCAVGDQTAALVARGARVIGVDANPELLAAARARALDPAQAQFLEADVRTLTRAALEPRGGDCQPHAAGFDGIWASFVAAYFTDFEPVLFSWAALLRPGGFIALVEVDDMFGHEPLDAAVKARFEGFAREALAAARYDFHMGDKLARYLARAGFAVDATLALPDAELAFDGPARPEALAAWRARFERMALLRAFCGSDFERIRDAFLACLELPEHRSTARVVACIATRAAP